MLCITISWCGISVAFLVGAQYGRNPLPYGPAFALLKTQLNYGKELLFDGSTIPFCHLVVTKPALSDPHQSLIMVGGQVCPPLFDGHLVFIP